MVSRMQQDGSKYFARRPLPHDHWVGSKGQNSTFLEHGHVAYQIKGRYKCCNMEENMLPADHPPEPGVGPKGRNSFFSEYGYVAYQIKGNMV